jgi:hypothetical protein
MLTGTPLDLTPFGDLLKAIGGLYWLLMLALIALALWLPKRWWVKLPVAAAIAALFILPVQRHVDKRAVEASAGKARMDAALAHFEMRCKGAGEKITRTVENVDGVVWMKWRDKAEPSDDADQFKLFDPYGRDCTEQDCIEQLLRLDTKTGRFAREVELRKGRYRFVESIDPAAGKRYRYVGAMVPRWSDAGVKKHRQETGQDIPDDAYWFKHEKLLIDKFGARYGITWDDISTREDREHWIAGGSIKVIDLQTNEVIAERVGYMMDRGSGSTAGFRSPWGYALRNACPLFPSDGTHTTRSWPRTETLIFVSKVLQPTTGN